MSKKIGSLPGNKKDIEHRTQLPTLALNTLTCIRKRPDKGKQKKKNKNKTVQILESSWFWFQTVAQRHWMKQRMTNWIHSTENSCEVFGIIYLTKISNNSLYIKRKEIPLSIQILQLRCSLFGHALRCNPEICVNEEMIIFFTNNTKKPKEGPK